MRSNIARTWASGRVPAVTCGSLLVGLRSEGGDELDQLIELLRLGLSQLGVRRHRWRGVDQRALDRVLAEAVADVAQIWPQRVPVFAHLVAAQAARCRHHPLPLLEPGRDLEIDLR